MAWTNSLPDLTRRERDCTFAVIQKRGQYPFGVKTQGATTPASAVVHNTLPEAGFFRQPYNRVNMTVWLFESEDERKAFVAAFGGEVLQ